MGMAAQTLATTTATALPARAAVVGLGKSGLSAARYLARRGVAVAVTDSRAEPPGLAELRRDCPDATLYMGGFAQEALAGVELVLASPGIALREPFLAGAAAAGLPVVGDIELFARAVASPVVAITGSNGKSTVTTLVGEMAAAAGRDVRVGGNLGTPALDLITDVEPDLYVLELSSFQLETTHSLAAAAATVLNLSPDHMDRYVDEAEYAAAKARIFHRAKAAVVNGDDPRVVAMAAAFYRPMRFSLRPPTGLSDYGLVDGWLARGRERWLPLAELRIAGLHNVANALAALALGEAVGLPVEPMLEALRRFTGLPHRTQWVAERDGVTWYDDSKGTNVGATLAALHGMPGKAVLIVGGDGKGQDFSPLRDACAAKARAVVLIGRDAPLIEAALAGAAPLVHAADLDQAVARAAGAAQPGDAVLLSPACASFDMFRNYDERGELFAAAVRRYLA